MSKNPDAFKTISEVAEELDLPQHVLRFWETRFTQIKPMKRGGGRRYYRPDDVDLLRGIKTLLYEEGYTIRGVQRLLKEQGNRLAIDIGNGHEPAGILAGEPDLQADGMEAESPAISVADLGAAKTKKGKGLLGRLTGKSDDEDDFSGAAISGTDLKTLQSTLQELLECKRLLDQTRQG